MTLQGAIIPAPEWNWERWQWRSTPHFPKLLHYWNLRIRLFSAISRTCVGGGSYTCRDAVGVFYSPIELSKTIGRETPGKTGINNSYLKEAQKMPLSKHLINSRKNQVEYIQSKINKMRNSIEDRKSRLAWQAINNVNRWKNTSRLNQEKTTSKVEKSFQCVRKPSSVHW